ncbi:MAG TPA: sialidase family protein [Longimicrobiales bacterium]|nr:sialidase family protein [Longimicrobiales bacterium]
MSKLLHLAVGLAVATHMASAQRIAVGPNVPASTSRPDTPHNEVVIAVDPANAMRMIACSMLLRTDGTYGTAAYVSFDGGQSWSGTAESSGAATDPACAYGVNGAVFFTHKNRLGSGRPVGELTGSDYDRLAIHRSRDGGRTWEPEVRGPQTTDRPWIAVDPNAAPPPWGRLFVAYNAHVHSVEPGRHDHEHFRNAVALQASDDGGAHFHTQALRALLEQTAEVGSNAALCDVVVLSDGTAVVLYAHQRVGGRNPATGKPAEIGAALHVLRSADQGESFESAVRVAEITGGYNTEHTRAVPARLAADPGSRAFRDRLYAVWADFGSGRGRILVAHSADAGKSWSTPRAVSDDTVRARAPGGPDSFMATVAVNRAGVVGVLWYDRRDQPDNRGYRVRFAASFDGGLTWTPSVPASSAPNSAKLAQQRGQTAPFFLVSGGDTAGLTAGPDGRFWAAWIDNRTGVQQVWTASLNVSR